MRNNEARVVELFDQVLRKEMLAQYFPYHYQPQFCLNTGDLRGYECLMRMNHPARGLILPGEFIHKLDKKNVWEFLWPVMLEKLAKDQGCIGPDLKLAVNVSPLELEKGEHSAFIGHLYAMAKEGLIDPTMLEIEITEDAIISDIEQVESSLRRLESLGTQVVVDDFGSGYCGLGYIDRLRIQGIKIDRTLIDGLESSEVKETIVESVVKIAKVKGCFVLAEGLETQDQVDKALLLGCDYGQGHLLGSPAPSFVRPI